MYDQDKLNAYWKKRDEIRAEWRANGWNGEKEAYGRDIFYSCGHVYWAGYGIAYPEKGKLCFECRSGKKWE